MVSVAIAMFSISAADAIIELHFRVALFYQEDPKASLDFEGNFQWWSDVSFCLYVVQTWLGDSVLVRLMVLLRIWTYMSLKDIPVFYGMEQKNTNDRFLRADVFSGFRCVVELVWPQKLEINFLL